MDSSLEFAIQSTLAQLLAPENGIFDKRSEFSNMMFLNPY